MTAKATNQAYVKFLEEKNIQYADRIYKLEKELVLARKILKAITRPGRN